MLRKDYKTSSNQERQSGVEVVTKLPQTDASVDVANTKLKKNESKAFLLKHLYGATRWSKRS